MKTTQEPMNASAVFCPNEDCCARGKIGAGNIVIHERARPRYRCKICGKTFSASQGTMFARLAQAKELDRDRGNPADLWMPGSGHRACTGCRTPRTVAAWRDRAGVQC